MMKRILSTGVAALLVLGVSACGTGESGGDTGSAGTSEGSTPATNAAGSGDASSVEANAGEVKEYTFHGTVKKVDTERQMITIDHEKIGDYMEAMTMPFKVADPSILGQVKVGDQTHFTLRVAGDQALLTKVQAGHDEGESH